MRATGQLPLPIFAGSRFAEIDFCEAPSNAAACAWIRRTAEWPTRRLALWGEAGCGKTHLLHIWAKRHGAELWTGPALSGLPDLPRHGVALDDADAADDTALFHLLNAASEAGLPVLIAARTPPSRWTVALPDLASRLRSMTAVQIGPPEDSLLRVLIARQLADRQLRLRDESVQEWLVRRLPRSAAVLADAMARLDGAALERQHPITVPFAREVLADLLLANEISGTEDPPSQTDPRVL